MTKHKRLAKLTAMAVLLACWSFAGCYPHVAGAPSRKPTPLETVLAYNDSLAQANKSIAMGVINANGQNPPLISVDAANTVLSMQSRVADFDRQLTPLLVNAATVSGNSAKIRLLLAEILAAAKDLPVDLGITDVKTKETISTAVGNITTLAGQILDLLTASGLLK
jgi:hypothetical protein